MNSFAGTLENYSPEQKDKVSKLAMYTCQDLRYNGPEVCTWFLLRVGRARNFDFSEMKIMMANYIKFRSEEFIRNALRLDFQNEITPLQKEMESGFFHIDRFGRPVYILIVESCQWERMLSVYSIDQVVSWHLHKLELYLNIINPICSKIANKRIDNVLTIVDFKDVNPLIFTKGKLKEMIKKLSFMTQNFYPEILGKLYMINVPTLFYVFWQIMKIWLHETTKKKIEIDSGPATEKLLKDIDISNLHKRFGGQKEGDIRDNPGPWSSDISKALDLKVFTLPAMLTMVKQYFLTEEERNELKEKAKSDKKIRIRSLMEIEEEGEICNVPHLKLNVSLSNLNLH
jgi:hypothetical protein